MQGVESDMEIKRAHGYNTDTRIVVRPYASALPLGCFAFGVGNTLMSVYAFHWIGSSETRLMAVLLLAFVALLELIPCIMAFLSRDTGGATAMGVFSAVWVVQGIQFIIAAPHAPSVAMGMFLLMLAILLAMLAIVSFPGKPLLGILRLGCLGKGRGSQIEELYNILISAGDLLYRPG
jgi:succinate-acetate transporter protein